MIPIEVIVDVQNNLLKEHQKLCIKLSKETSKKKREKIIKQLKKIERGLDKLIDLIPGN